MKLTILLFTALISISAAGVSQTITFSGKNVPLVKVFEAIEKQTAYTVTYTADVLEGTKAVTIKVKKAPLNEFLDMVLKGQSIMYVIGSRSILLSRKVGSALIPMRKAGVVKLLDISGKVLNENGEGITASILVQGTGKGVSSNSEGYFDIKGVAENAVLVITGVGIEPSEMSINGRTNIVINANRRVTSEQEVVVNAGYYKTTNRLTTGNISRVDAKTIEGQPISNPLQALQGRVPGLDITQQTGVPGSGFTVQIRGQNSLRVHDNDPLFIVDGVPFLADPLGSGLSDGIIFNGANPLNNLNPLDIQSIEILKDADATAIYGSRGANGVVLISTKRGQAGMANLDIDYYRGMGCVTRTMSLLNREQWLEMRREAFSNSNEPITLVNNAYDLLLWDTMRSTDWQDELVGGTASSNRLQTSLSGGSEQLFFRISGGYYEENTVFPIEKGLRRASGSFSITHVSPNRKLKALLNTNYVFSDNQLPAFDPTSLSQTLAPIAPPSFDSGSLHWEDFFENPFATLSRKYRGKNDNLVADFSANYFVFKNLRLTTNLGYNYMQSRENVTIPIRSIDPRNNSDITGSSGFGNSSNRTWLFEPQLEYFNVLNGVKISALIGSSFQETVREDQIVLGQGYTSDAFLDNLQAAPEVSVTRFDFTRYRYNAVFGRMNLNFNDKYIVNLTGRRDGSSRFGPNRQFANFGAAGVAWIFSEDNFIKRHFPFISFGKIRASFGLTGSDQIGDYQFMDTYSNTLFPYHGNSGLIPTQLVNPEYAWETTRKFEASLSLGFLRDRINISTSYYLNRSSNQLVGLPVPVLTGFATVQYNLPAVVQNSGLEVELNTMNIIGTKLSWSTSVQVTIPRNKLIAFPNIESSPYANIYIVGKSLNTRPRYKWTGVDPMTGNYSFMDVNGDGQISIPEDRIANIEVGKKWYAGLQNQVNFKGITLVIFCQFVNQTGENYLSTFYTTPGSLFSNQPVLVMDRWRKTGDITNIQKFVLSSKQHSDAGFSDRAISNASFMRIKNIEISWNLPGKWIKKVNAQHAKLSIYAQNAATVTNYIGLDPENQNRNSSLPPLKVIAAGLQVRI